jgi:hypothetical protein
MPQKHGNVQFPFVRRRYLNFSLAPSGDVVDVIAGVCVEYEGSVGIKVAEASIVGTYCAGLEVFEQLLVPATSRSMKMKFIIFLAITASND